MESQDYKFKSDAMKARHEKERQRLSSICTASQRSLDAEIASARRQSISPRAASNTKRENEKRRLDAESLGLRRTLEVEEDAARRSFISRQDAAQAKLDAGRRRVVNESTIRYSKLKAEEVTGQKEHSHKRDALKSRFKDEKNRLALEYRATKDCADKARRELDEKVIQSKRSLGERQIVVQKVKLEMARFDELNPILYLLRVLFLLP